MSSIRTNSEEQVSVLISGFDLYERFLVVEAYMASDTSIQMTPV